ncbi:GNAT family N-acetyltransferase [Companilactobacillus sp. HBUAS56257]|uniref:GNAT family N-acetyltransferase n=1 Tax=Companilactobacillus sp. HBUAS56257 TaxID=3109360 RepID=UPI002FF040D1
MKIRKCNLDDLTDLQKLSSETFQATFGKDNTKENMQEYLEEAYNSQVLTRELSDSHSAFYFVYYEDKLAGYLKLNILDAQSESMPADYLEIERIYFKKEFQHLGLGTKLFEFALQRARDLKKKYIWLGVWENNYPAQKFYQKLGFKRFSQHHFVMGDSNQTDYLLKKELRSTND